MRDDVLRYLGYEDQIIDEKTQEALVGGLKYVEGIEGKYTYKIVNTYQEVQDVLARPSRRLEEILMGAERVVIFAATLGLDFDKTLRRWQLKSPSDGMILNACGSARIENMVETMVRAIEQEKKLHAGPRYSPGYGDLSLEVQKNLLSYLGADKKLGIVLNESYVMLPSKSITGIFPLSKERSQISYESCDDCILRMTCDQKTCRRKI